MGAANTGGIATVGNTVGTAASTGGIATVLGRMVRDSGAHRLTQITYLIQ